MSSFIWEVSISLFNTVTSFITAGYFFSIFSEKRKYSSITYLAFIVFFLAPLLVTNSFLNMGILVVCIFIQSLNYKTNIYNKVLFTMIFIALNVVAEISVGFLLMHLFSVTFETKENSIFMAFGSLISKLFVSILIYIISFAKNKILFGKFQKMWISIYILPIATFFVTYALYQSMSFFEHNTFMENLSLISLIMLVISNMLIFQIVNDIHNSIVNENKLALAEELIKQQEKQYRLLFENNETVIKLRHDYKNFIIGMISELNANDFDRMKRRLNDELDMLNEISKNGICGNSVIDTIISYKKAEAEAKNISVNFEYRNLHNIHVSGIDISILLGNAIDNAIEALEQITDTHKKVIDVYLYHKGEQIMLTIKNPVKENKNTEKLQTEKGEMHGYGIINMKSIAAKYGGTVTFDCRNKVFTTIVLLNDTHE